MADAWTAPGASGTGVDSAHPGSFATCEAIVNGGGTIWMQPGSYLRTSAYTITAVGTNGNPVIWKAVTPGTAICQWNGTGGGAYFQGTDTIAAGGFGGANVIHDVEWQDLVFDGRNGGPGGAQAMNVAIKLFRYSHRIGIRRNVVRYTGASAFNLRACDYVQIVGNQCYRTGSADGSGWSSSINLHFWDGAVFLDGYTGFHIIVANNIVSGAYDPWGQAGSTLNPSGHTDGAAFITDCPSTDYTIPLVLCVNNVMFENGKAAFNCHKGHGTWIVNNTMYGNGLDLALAQPGYQAGVNNATGIVMINNLAYSWNNAYTFALQNASTATFSNNVAFGGAGTTGITSDSTQINVVDPKFYSVPTLDATADGQYLTALEPWNIGSNFRLQGSSPIRGTGIDPRTLSSDSNIKADLHTWLSTDVLGNPRSGV